MGDARDVSALSVEEKRAMLAALLKKKAAAEEQEWPLSHGQRALWFVHRLDPASSAYNIAFGLRIRARIDVPALTRTLAAIMRRHPLLRCSFPMLDGAPRLVITGGPEVPFEHVDAAGWSEGDLRSRVAERHLAPFDLERGLAHRIALFSVSEHDHVLLFTLHHIIADGASLGILIDEIQRTYWAQAAGTPVVMPPLPCEFRDYVDWQSRMLAAEGERLERFWTAALSGELPILELPTDSPRPPFQRFKGGTADFSIEPGVLGQLERLARSEGVTLFAVLLAAFYTLLSRYSGQTDVIVGIPALGRNRHEFASLVGYFVNPIALRATFDDDPTFLSFVKRVGAIAQGGLAHQDYPFPLLVERLHPARDPARSPVFQAMFNLLRVPSPPGGVAGHDPLPVTPFRLPQEEGQFDLALDLFDLNGQLNGALRYDADLFERVTAARIAQHYNALLTSAAASPELTLSALPLLLEAERRQILTERNATDLDYDPAEGVERMITAQAGRSPAAIAVTGFARTLTYGELETRSNQLTAWLRARGVGPGALVGICLQRTPDLVVALLGILKAGAAYVPLDPGFPPARLAHMVEDSALALIITDAESAHVLPASGAQMVRMDRDSSAIAAEEPAVPAVGSFDPEQPAYVLYTSGSTGRPKGVQIPRRALANFMRGMQQRPGIRSSDVLVAVTTLSFDIAGLELFLPLTVGATVVLATADQARDGALLRQLIESSRATMMQATPATWHLLIDAGWRGSHSFVILCGGEPLPRQLAAQLLERAGRVWNMYGPTETTIWSTVAEVTPDAPITIGTPVANTQVYVLDRHMQPVPTGAAGELCIGGEGVALGYLDRPELTAERFVRDPFSLRAGARMYRTGDLARFTSNGAIEYLGRKDFQVKVRGFRIELGEIETVLAAHPGVKQAVAGVVGADADARLVAWIVSDAGDLDESGLRQHARKQLPEYMVPAAFVTLDLLPLTPNGKIDRRALPAPVVSPRVAEVRVAPRSPVERGIAAIWTGVLRTDDLSVHDNFFERGGHSLLAAQVTSRIRDAFGVDLPVRTMFEASTIAELAEAVERALAPAMQGDGGAAVDAPSRSAVSSLPPVVAGSFADGSGPLSYAQRRLWFFEQLEPGTSVFNIPLALRLMGQLDAARLRRALERMAARHETLRTAFAAGDGAPVQVVLDAITLPFTFHDLRSYSPREQADVLASLRRAATAPFELDRAPLWRVVVVRAAEEEHLLLWTFHHLIADGWSLRVAVRELIALYESEGRGPAENLPPLPVQYRDYAKWQTVDVGETGFEQQLGFWRAHLQGPLPALELPTDASRPGGQSFTGGGCFTTVSAELTQKVEHLARTHGATSFMVLFAAFQALLSRLSGQSDVVVGVPVAGRTDAALDSLIGVFVNTLPLRSEVRPDRPFVEFLKGVRHTALEAFERQEVPFERIVQAVQPERGLGRTPIFQALFNMFDADPVPVKSMDGVTLEMDGASQDWSSKFDVTMYATVMGAALRLDFVYDAELFTAERAAEMLQQYVSLLDQVIAAPSTLIGHLSLVTAGATALLPDPREPLARVWEGSISARVRSWAQSDGSRIAVADPQTSLTYGELDARANALASHLRARGVREGDRIAVVALRSAALVPTLLGTWRAGAAFVIIDPAYPDQRVASCLEVAHPAGIIAMDEESGASLLTRDWCEEHGAWWELEGAVESGPPQATSASDLPPAEEVGPDQLAYLAFTSGTTGRPKAVAGAHAPLSHFLAWHARQFGFTSQDRVSVLSGLAHDPLMRDLFTPLWVGGTAVIPDGERMFEPGYLADWIRDERITAAHITPALAGIVLAGGGSDASLPAIRALFCGGDRLRYPLAAALQKLAPSARIVNFYGATETPQAVGWDEVETSTTGRREEIPIGRGVPGVQLLVLTGRGAVAGIGELGEIYVRTPYLSLGYFEDEPLTRERFVPSPHPCNAEDRMYRTGDWGRYLPDGRVQLVGRRDLQVKVRGFRIELGEVEAVLERHEAIRQAVASVYDDGAGDTRLVAYLVYEEGADTMASELRRFVRGELPDYMVPSLFVTMDAMPLTPNGKVNRRVLPPPIDEGRRGAERVAPRTEMERLVAALWTEALGTSDISVHDSFFDIGGHSLLSMDVVTRLERQLGIRLPRHVIRDTLEQIGAACEQLVTAGPAAGVADAPVEHSASRA